MFSTLPYGKEEETRGSGLVKYLELYASLVKIALGEKQVVVFFPTHTRKIAKRQNGSALISVISF